MNLSTIIPLQVHQHVCLHTYKLKFYFITHRRAHRNVQKIKIILRILNSKQQSLLETQQ